MKLRTRLMLALVLLLAVGVIGDHVLSVMAARRVLFSESKNRATALADVLFAAGSFAHAAESQLEDIVGAQMVVEATLAAHLVDVAENRAGMAPDEIKARLRDVVESTVLDEFWITDEQGHAYLRTVEEIDFTFPSEPGERGQAHEFRPLLEQERGLVVQDATPRDYDGRTFKYAAVSGIDGPRIVQVGLEAASLAELAKGMTAQDFVKSVRGVGGTLALMVLSDDGSVWAEHFLPEGDPRRVVIRPQDFGPEIEDARRTGESVARLWGDHMMVFLPVEGDLGPMMFAACFDATGTNAAIGRMRLRMAAVAVAILGLGVFVASRIAGGIASPLQQLTDEAAAIGKGDLHRRIEVEGCCEVRVLADAFNGMVDSLNVHIEQLQETTAAKERLEHELRIAAQVQRAMLPEAMPERPGLDIWAVMEPAHSVGGDFYDVCDLPGGRLGFTIGDVSGKGLPAALLASQSISVGRALSGQGLTMGEMMSRSNGVIFRSAEERGMFVTMIGCRYDPAAHVLQMANAGHPPPVLCRPGQAPVPLALEGSPPLGILPELSATELTAPLEVGDVVTFYTDGVTEAMNADGDLFGLERLYECLADVAGQAARQVVERVRAAVSDFVGAGEQSDDLTLLVLRGTA